MSTKPNVKPPVALPKPEKAKKPPVAYSLESMLLVLSVLEHGKREFAVGEKKESAALMDRYLRDLRRRLKPFAVQKVEYIAKDVKP